MKCPSCAFQSPPDMKFCGGCGHLLLIRCPSCTFQSPSNFRFCGACGRAFTAPSASPIPPSLGEPLVDSIVLRVPPALTVLGVAMCLVSLSMGGAGGYLFLVAMQKESPGFYEIAFGLLTLLFGGGGGIFILRRLFRPSGFIQVRAHSLLINTYSLGPMSGMLGGYMLSGLIDIVSVTKVGMATAQFTRCLGIRVASPADFVASQERLGNLVPLSDIKIGRQSARIILAAGNLSLFGKFLDLAMTLMGFTGTPKSADEVDVMEWNEKNWGYHILVPQIFIPGGVKRVVRIIAERKNRPAQTDTEQFAVALNT